VGKQEQLSCNRENGLDELLLVTLFDFSFKDDFKEDNYKRN